jgi:hypothetical protein
MDGKGYQDEVSHVSNVFLFSIANLGFWWDPDEGYQVCECGGVFVDRRDYGCDGMAVGYGRSPGRGMGDPGAE